MHTWLKTDGAQAALIITDLDPTYHQAARSLGYDQVPEGFARVCPPGTPHLDRVYRNFELSAEPMLLQAAGVLPAPWEEGLLAFLDRVEGQGVDWWLAGSGALAVRGIPVRPRDLDLIVDGPGAHRLGELLLDHLVEPVLPVEDWICRWWGRAFLHLRLEWVGEVTLQADHPRVSDFGPTAASRLEVVHWRGHAIRVPPLELQLEVSLRRGLTDRAELIRRYLAG